jgi:hypothetical protein
MPLGLKADRLLAHKAVGVEFTTLPTTLIGNVVKYINCTSQLSHSTKASNAAYKWLIMLSTVSHLILLKRNMYVPPVLVLSTASNSYHPASSLYLYYISRRVTVAVSISSALPVSMLIGQSCWGYSVSPGIIQFPGLRITPYWRYRSAYLRTMYCTHFVSVLTYAHHTTSLRHPRHSTYFSRTEILAK